MAVDLGTMMMRWIAAVLAAGCAFAAEPVRFTERKLDRKVPGCEVDFSWLEATSGPAEVRGRINAAIVGAFFKGTQKADFRKEAESFIKDCREEAPHMVGWSRDIGMERLRTRPPVLSFAYVAESFEGGAHPNAERWFLNLEPETGRQVRLESILVDGALPRLTEIAERRFRAERDLSPTADLKEEGFWWKDGRFHLNENYGFGETSLTFFYNQYEVAPYSMGVTEVEIPYAEILELLRPEFRRGFSVSGTPRPPAAAK
jgi:hypothetical protein